MTPSENEQIQIALEMIIKGEKQFEIIEFLLQSIKTEMKAVSYDRAEYKSLLRAIQKINKGKNDAIEALCDTNKLPAESWFDKMQKFSPWLVSC